MEVLSSATSPFKRRKMDNPSYEDDVELAIATSPEREREKSPSSDSSELRSSDLKEKSGRIEISKLIGNNLSGGIISTQPKNTSKKPRKSTVSISRKFITAKMPPQEEIDDFFSAAEKYEQKRFLEKYNFDVVKDVPLEGHYQWIPLKQ